jgi:hypothetical protein
VRSKLLDSFASIRSFDNQAHVRLAREDRRDAFSDERMVVYCENPDWTSHKNILRIFSADVAALEPGSFA